MTSKRKVLSLVTSIVLAMTLCLGMALPAFAIEYSTGVNASNPAKAAITKQLRMPVDTTIPDATFVFEFEAIGMDDEEDPTGMPEIPSVFVNYPADVELVYTKGGDDYAVAETPDFLADFISSSWTKGEGIYKYRITESLHPTSEIQLTGAPNEGAYYSEAQYEMEIWVEKDSNGNLFAKYVAVKIVLDYLDEYYEGETTEKKVDPEPGDRDGKENITIDDFSQVIFTNRYWTSDGGGEGKPDEAALTLIKEVAGNGAEKGKYFDFTVTVIQPEVINTGTQFYKAYIIDTNGQITTSADNYKGTFEKGDYILFESGEPETIHLKDNQKLVFVDLHVGANVEIEEAADGDYIPEYDRTFSNGGTRRAENVGTDWGFPRAGEDEGPHYIEKGTNVNTVTFTNIRSGATPTGISVDNLPYLVLILAGLIALAGYVVVKSRKNAKYCA